WADYDNDGDLDVIVQNQSGGQPVLYRNDGGTFSRMPPSVLSMPDGNYSGAAWGDYDNDGLIDLVLVGTDFTRLLRNRGDGTFGLVTTSPVTRPATTGGAGGANTATFADYDRDGFLDLYIGQTGNDLLFHNTGNSNQWLRVRCLTSAGRRDAIGAKVRATASI